MALHLQKSLLIAANDIPQVIPYLLKSFSFDELEFFIDIWEEEVIIFSEAIPVLKTKIPLEEGMFNMLRFHLQGSDYRMKIHVNPRFEIPYYINILVHEQTDFRT
ncbi:hypothetical protein MKW98_016220 [Papaver atlanticum]|uniref:Uncharacterized protein n=1 Tax=Papaver atlanticum TaxID=357466 RepID=A0AAD4XES5_9MAGN|nr:hypothetical protein MKW98_016220 [Papaver atlanticum]